MALCDVMLNDCGLATPRVRTRCFACGNRACRNCSQLTKRYHRWKRVRICNDCIENKADEIRAGSVVLAGAA